MNASNLIGLAPLLAKAERVGYAVAAFNFSNAETAQAIVEECTALRSPAVLMTGLWEIPLLGARMMADIAASLASRTDVPVCLQLDHAQDREVVRECIQAGFSSVMIDGSHLDFEQNVAVTRAVMEIARAEGVDVEGELGLVGRADDAALEGHAPSSPTDPARAAEFVERTGIQALAVAIGNAHGIYPQRPALDFERLEAIRRATPVPLVLHGGSGTPPDQLRRAIEIGITKVNIARELSQAYLHAVQQAIGDQRDRIWYSQAMLAGKAATAGVVRRWVRQLGCAGKVPGATAT